MSRMNDDKEVGQLQGDNMEKSSRIISTLDYMKTRKVLESCSPKEESTAGAVQSAAVLENAGSASSWKLKSRTTVLLGKPVWLLSSLVARRRFSVTPRLVDTPR